MKQRNEIIEELARLLCGKSWEAMSPVTKQSWVEKAERALVYLEPLIMQDLAPKVHCLFGDYTYGEETA